MKNQVSSISPFEWEITQSQLRQKQKAYFLEKILYPSVFFIFIFPQFGFLGIVISIVLYIKLKNDSKLQRGNDAVVEKYKINNDSINIIDNNKNNTYSWNKLSYFYTYSKTSPLFGSLFGKMIGDDFFIKTSDNKLLKLKVGSNDVERVKLSLSQKLEFKVPAKSSSSLATSSFRINSNSGLLKMLKKMPSNNSRVHNSRNIGFNKRSQEKQFHEQTISQRRNLQKEKDNFKKKILIILYIIIAIVVTIVYLVYKNKDLIINSNLNKNKSPSLERIVNKDIKDDSMIEKTNADKDVNSKIVLPKNTMPSDLKRSDEFWQRMGWPKNDIDLVGCKQDSDCELYFYFQSDSVNTIPDEINYNNYIDIVKENNNCFWGAINRKYKSLWWQRYPLLSSCDSPKTTKNQVSCNKYSKTCDVFSAVSK